MSRRGDGDPPSIGEKLIGSVLGGAAQLLSLRVLATCTHTRDLAQLSAGVVWCARCGAVEHDGRWHEPSWVDVFRG